jgi:hypothetical protein
MPVYEALQSNTIEKSNESTLKGAAAVFDLPSLV